ncbi:MAG: hypothetical protein AB2A00_11775 [Myxococcota bacterium]
MITRATASPPLTNDDYMFSPKTTDVLGVPALFLGEPSHKVTFVLPDVIRAKQDPAAKNMAGPAPTLPAFNARASRLVTAYSDLANALFLEPDATDILQAARTVAVTSTTGVPVVLTSDATGLVVLPDTAQFRVLSGDDNGPALVQQDLPSVGTGAVARLCSGDDGRFVHDGEGHLSFWRADGAGATVGLTQLGYALALTGEVAAPPVVVKTSVPDEHVVFLFHNESNGRVTRVVLQLASSGGFAITGYTEFPMENSISGSAAVGLVQGEIVVAVPQYGGDLAIIPLQGDTLTEWSLSGDDLSGVIAVRPNSTDTSDTFILGDSGARLHAWRNGQSLPGFPITFAAAERVRETPAAVDWLGNGRLEIVVPQRDLVVSVQLGTGSAHPRARTWPEYQRDSLNSGCIHAQDVLP